MNPLPVTAGYVELYFDKHDVRKSVPAEIVGEFAAHPEYTLDLVKDWLAVSSGHVLTHRPSGLVVSRIGYVGAELSRDEVVQLAQDLSAIDFDWSTVKCKSDIPEAIAARGKELVRAINKIPEPQP